MKKAIDRWQHCITSKPPQAADDNHILQAMCSNPKGEGIRSRHYHEVLRGKIVFLNSNSSGSSIFLQIEKTYTLKEDSFHHHLRYHSGAVFRHQFGSRNLTPIWVSSWI